MKPVQKTDWNVVFPMPAKWNSLSLERCFSKDEAAQLKMGFLPHQMEDKWFIYFENDVLYFHRSWTGYCIYQVFFTQEGDALRITQALVNRDPGQYTETRAKRDEENISQLIDLFLLNKTTLT